jgi:hypothetical protein
MRFQKTIRKIETHETDPPADFTLAPRKVALVAADARPAAGYAPFLAEIAAAADAQGCDTIMYALAPGGVSPATQSQLFGSSRAVETIFLEMLYPGGDAVIEVWRKATSTPHRFRQRLVGAQDRVASKRALIDGLPARTFGSTMFLACGEANIIATQRGSAATVDDFGFMAHLLGGALILNPLHTYMVRHEMKEKRRRYSEDGRVVLSVWNPGYQQHEPEVPWQAFANGREITDRISRVAFAHRSIHLGVFELS